jgi:hypothetical protein
MNSVKKLTNYVFDRYKVINKIAFFINEEYIFDHYSCVLKSLDSSIFDIVLTDKFKQKKYQKLIDKLTLNSWNVVFLSDIFYLKKYKVLLTHLYLGGDRIDSGSLLFRVKSIVFKLAKTIGINWPKEPPKQYFQNILGVYNIRFMYGADAGGVKFGKYNHLFNEFFCHGPRDSKIVREEFNRPVYEMGYPRYDSYFDNVNNKELKHSLLKKYLCDHKKPTILWICTVSEYFSTIETYEQYMQKLTDKYNVILRPHPLEIDPQYSRYNQKVYDIVNSDKFIVSNNPYQNMSELYLIADYVFCDYGGTIFSALYVDKNILLMNHKNVHMDAGVYGSTSMEVRNYLPSINEEEVDDIEEIIDNILPSSQAATKIKEARKIYFGNKIGACSTLVANKLEGLL